MRTGWQVASVLFLAVSVGAALQSLQLSLRDPLGPGPGFFPFWLSTVGAVLAAVLLVQVTRTAPAPGAARLLPERPAALRVLGTLAALAVATALLEPLGFRLTLLLFNGFLVVALGARSWWTAALFAVAGSFGVFHVFYHWLKVPLPIGLFGI